MKSNIMKKLLIVLVLVFFSTPTFAGDYQFYFFGINSKFFKEAKWGYIVLGVATSAATHWVGHMAYGKIVGADVGTDGVWRETIRNASPTDNANFARSGFVAQSIVGLVLTSFEKSRKWDFTKGYVAMNAIEIWTYPIRWRNEGDIHLLNKYGNGNAEWAGYSVIALHNILREDFKR